MNDGPKNTNGADNPMLPVVVDRATWQALPYQSLWRI
jgi:hypothetical protein